MLMLKCYETKILSEKQDIGVGEKKIHNTQNEDKHVPSSKVVSLRRNHTMLEYSAVGKNHVGHPP